MNKNSTQRPPAEPGFALIATIIILSLLTLIALGTISLSVAESKISAQSKYENTAKANARFALQLAIAELQSNLGPDQRISASTSILDSTPETPEIDGLAENTSPHIIGVWDSWNAWLNAGDNGSSIQDTYSPGRKSRFRKWLISHPIESSLTNPEALFEFNHDNAVQLISPSTSAQETDRVLAGLIKVSDDSNTLGRYAWWVGGQNQKANVKRAQTSQPETTPSSVELINGSPGTTDLTNISGFEDIAPDIKLFEKTINYNTLELNDVSKKALKNHFHDLAVNTGGLLADVRWGGMKKDLNLLFELDQLPAELTRTNRPQSPSPRPLSPDLLSKNPQLANRGFSSFEMMREYYRIYKSSGTHPLEWNNAAPSTREFLGHPISGEHHAALESYRRVPVILKYYSVYSLRSEKIDNAQPGPTHYNHDLVFTTVAALWNPYNVPMDLPSGQFSTYTLPYKILPTDYSGYKNGTSLNGKWITMNQGSTIYDMGRDFSVKFSTDDQKPIRFEPGQIRIFSKKGLNFGSEGANLDLTPGFDPSAAYGQRIRVYSDKPDDATRWQVSLRIAPRWTIDGTSVYWGGNPGAFGNLLRDKGNNYGNPATIGTMIDWTGPDLDLTNIAPTSSDALATFEPGVEETIPFAVIGVSLKTATKSIYDLHPGMPDYRSKNWIHGQNAVAVQKMNVNYTDENLRNLQRLDSGYQLHFSPVNGQNDLGQFFSRDVTNTLTTIGTGIGSELANAVPVLELPSVPATSLAGFAGMRLTPGWYQLPAYAEVKGAASSRFGDNTSAYTAGVPGVGIGNAFAHPMIPGDQVYTYHDVSKLNPQSRTPDSYSPNTNDTDSKAFSDYWDHALLINDGLWDTWFTSSMVDPTRPTAPSSDRQKQRITDFYSENKPLPYPHYTPDTNGKNPTEITELLTDQEGYKKAAAYLVNSDSFNVNSTSVIAWRALLSRLENNQITYRDNSGKLQIIQSPENTATISRFMTAPSNLETSDIYNGTNVEGIGRMWTGVRYLSSGQLDKLAEECVKQVKLRGPFLNMSDFINRRLSTSELGLSGALQAAIDYDDQNPDPASINHRYKTGNDMITDSDHIFANYPFEQAANGSRFTGAPGYVVQSDILRPLANSLTTRDDTFIIRTYGDALASDGTIKARAWCEATVSRTTNYLDPSNPPETPVTIIDKNGTPQPNPDLSTTNQRFGRAFKITSFRWLSESEI